MIRNRIVIFFLAVSCLSARERADIIVAKDGSGQFTSIQSALNSIPNNNSKHLIVLVKNGVYEEKLFITQRFISIVGEHQDSTKIVYAELRKNWLKHNPSDWGSAVVNIDSSVTDLTIANLTIHNNYGSLYGDNDHQFAIWGKGTRINLLYCNVIADGGDTVSLWNEKEGMYFHSYCYFEGWVDFVCPRGWCYITDSRFFGHNKTASLWHHGANDPDQKFVIRYSSFDGVEGFPLGRHHVDGQFYLLDCVFSERLADQPIHYPSYSPNAKPWKWGERHYFHNCRREGGNYEWFKDNLFTAKNSPAPDDVTPLWTFGGRWDPLKTIPHVLPFVSHPSPRSGASVLTISSITLSWLGVRNTERYRVNVVSANDSARVIFVTEPNVSISGLTPGNRYVWSVSTISGLDTLTGPQWEFATKP